MNAVSFFHIADPNPAVSHVMVLPLDPRAAAAVACTTPSATDAQNVDVMELFGGGDPLTDGMCNPCFLPHARMRSRSKVIACPSVVVVVVVVVVDATKIASPSILGIGGSCK